MNSVEEDIWALPEHFFLPNECHSSSQDISESGNLPTAPKSRNSPVQATLNFPDLGLNLYEIRTFDCLDNILADIINLIKHWKERYENLSEAWLMRDQFDYDNKQYRMGRIPFLRRIFIQHFVELESFEEFCQELSKLRRQIRHKTAESVGKLLPGYLPPEIVSKIWDLVREANRKQNFSVYLRMVEEYGSKQEEEERVTDLFEALARLHMFLTDVLLASGPVGDWLNFFFLASADNFSSVVADIRNASHQLLGLLRFISTDEPDNSAQLATNTSVLVRMVLPPLESESGLPEKEDPVDIQWTSLDRDLIPMLYTDRSGKNVILAVWHLTERRRIANIIITDDSFGQMVDADFIHIFLSNTRLDVVSTVEDENGCIDMTILRWTLDTDWSDRKFDMSDCQTRHFTMPIADDEEGPSFLQFHKVGDDEDELAMHIRPDEGKSRVVMCDLGAGKVLSSFEIGCHFLEPEKAKTFFHDMRGQTAIFSDNQQFLLLENFPTNPRKVCTFQLKNLVENRPAEEVLQPRHAVFDLDPETDLLLLVYARTQGFGQSYFRLHKTSGSHIESPLKSTKHGFPFGPYKDSMSMLRGLVFLLIGFNTDSGMIFSVFAWDPLNSEDQLQHIANLLDVEDANLRECRLLTKTLQPKEKEPNIKKDKISVAKERDSSAPPQSLIMPALAFEGFRRQYGQYFSKSEEQRRGEGESMDVGLRKRLSRHWSLVCRERGSPSRVRLVVRNKDELVLVSQDYGSLLVEIKLGEDGRGEHLEPLRAAEEKWRLHSEAAERQKEREIEREEEQEQTLFNDLRQVLYLR